MHEFFGLTSSLLNFQILSKSESKRNKDACLRQSIAIIWQGGCHKTWNKGHVCGCYYIYLWSNRPFIITISKMERRTMVEKLCWINYTCIWVPSYFKQQLYVELQLLFVSLGRVHLFNSNTGILLIWQFTLSNVVGITDPVSDVGTTFDAEVVKNI